MKMIDKAVYAIAIGIAFAGLSTLLMISDNEKYSHNSLVEKLDKVKKSIKKNRIAKTGNRNDISDCFI
jgi:hypothetical protein